MSSIFEDQLVMAAAAFVLGLVVAGLPVLLARSGKRRPDPGEDHRTRALQAELRVARKSAATAEEELERTTRDLAAMQEEQAALRQAVFEKENKIHAMRKELGEECAKTQNLRNALSERATESQHAQLQVREMETALCVAEAGSDVANQEVSRLTAETAELTSRLKKLQAKMEQDTACNMEKDQISADYAMDT